VKRALPLLVALLAACGASSCAMVYREPPPMLAQTRKVADYPTYSLRRIGLLPLVGSNLDPRRQHEFRQAFLFEFARNAPYEVVALDESQIAEVDPSRPYERGEYSSRTILDLAQRYRLDGLLVGAVTQLEVYSPQLLGVQLELVSAETGLVIWSSTVHIDGGDRSLTPNFEHFRRMQADDPAGSADLQVTLLSPARLARFAAYEIARTL
jgi:hypothetical protein